MEVNSGGYLASREAATHVQDWTQGVFDISYYFIFDSIESVLVTLYQWGHFFMLIMRNLNLISVQSWTYLEVAEVSNCFSIYHTSWITSGPKSNFICDTIPTKDILFFFGCSEENSTWLITSELANQRARKVLFTCVVYTNLGYSPNTVTWCA